MNTPRRSFIKLPVIAAAAGIALWLAITAFASNVGQTPAQKRELNFSHKLHADLGTECAQCHAAAASKSATDDLLPGHNACAECHDVTKAEDCKICHQASSPKLSARINAPSPVFDHERHLTKGKVRCAVCHSDLDAVLPAGQAAHLPRMADCMGCHTREHVKNDCRTCHLPGDELVPADHSLDWTRAHGIAANTEESCNLCHAADHCLKCHNGDPVFNPHPRNYVSRHGQDAHLSDMTCATCHDQRDFCSACHRRMNVLPAGHFKPGWVTADGGDHAMRAEFDLESCMACHDDPGKQPVCARCHKK